MKSDEMGYWDKCKKSAKLLTVINFIERYVFMFH